jgi:small subunit ribosomal protein S20
MYFGNHYPNNQKGKTMANIKSSKKRILTSQKNTVKNVAFKSSIKTALKKALELGKGEDKEALSTAVSKVYQLCDKAVVKGILHKNTAARKKSRLSLALKKLAEKV